MNKIFFRVYVILNDNSNEKRVFSFDFADEYQAAKFAAMAYKSEVAYDRVYIDVLEYDPQNMGSSDDPSWREVE